MNRQMSDMAGQKSQVARPSFGEAFRFWLKLGFISFGGPTGQIAIMQTELVEKKKWVSQSRFLHALNFCMLLPGPEAQQLAIYIGWLLHKTWGGIVAGDCSDCRPSHCKEGTEERSDVGTGGARFRCDLFFQSSISCNHSQCWRDWICWGAALEIEIRKCIEREFDVSGIRDQR